MRFLSDAWSTRAACLDYPPDVFFPDKPGPGNTAEARQVCGGCPVQVECLADALARGENYGVWGGLTEDQRKELMA